MELIDWRFCNFYLLICWCEDETKVFLNGHKSCNSISVVPAHETNHSLNKSDEHSQLGLLLDTFNQPKGFIEVSFSNKHHQM
jgi:hypothetical protein